MLKVLIKSLVENPTTILSRQWQSHCKQKCNQWLII